MKYLKLYESFIKLLKENVEGKKFFLLLAPSASGKTTFANNQGIYHWYDNPNADKVLIGTDNVYKQKATQLLYDIVAKDMPKLSELMQKAGDGLHLLEHKDYKDFFNIWKEEASEEEKSRYEEVKKAVGFDERCIDSKGREDGRVTFMAWVAYYLPAKTIIFDDISDAITNYFSVETILLFTPLDHFLSNIINRNRPDNPEKSEYIDVNNKNTALYQYCRWFQATDKPDLDNKFYTLDNVEKMIASTGHNNPKEILDLLGVSNEMVNGFYLTVRPGSNFNKIINSRDKSTGRAEDASSLNF